MTKEQLKYLAMLPQVIDALNAFAAEAEAVRAAAARVGLGAPTPNATRPASRACACGPNYNHQDMRECFEARRNVGPLVTPPSTEEQAVGLDPNAPAHLQDVKAERARFLRQMKQADPARAAKLAQFKHDGVDLPAPTVGYQRDAAMEDPPVRVTPLNIGGGNE
jgi:hypothetical protein